MNKIFFKSAFITIFSISAAFAQMPQLPRLPQAERTQQAPPQAPQPQQQQQVQQQQPVQQPQQPQQAQQVQQVQPVQQAQQEQQPQAQMPLPQATAQENLPQPEQLPLQVQEQQPQAQIAQLPTQIQNKQEPQKRIDCPQYQQGVPKVGLLARFNLNSFSYGGSKSNKGVGFGLGIGGGVVRNTPINHFLTISPEAGFYHRKLYSDDRPAPSFSTRQDYVFNQNTQQNETITITDTTKYEGLDVTEFTLSLVPVMAQIMPFQKPFYIAMGIQIDIPIYTEYILTDADGEEFRDKSSNRAGYDLGLALGLGYDITESFNVNIRSVIGMKSLSGKSVDKSSYNQYGIAVTFF